MRLSVINLLRHVGHPVQKPRCSVMVSRLSWITGTGITELLLPFTKPNKIIFRSTKGILF